MNYPNCYPHLGRCSFAVLREFLDELISVADSGLRAMTGNHKESVDSGHYPPASELARADRRTAASLMRINHCGEVCAQALYEGQALTAKSPAVKHQLKQAAAEERKHLALCRARLNELNARPSIFEPVFFAASVGIGAIAGQLGDRVSLGFVEATEDQVCKHLDRHIAKLNANDKRTKSMLQTIRTDEAQHQASARESGGKVFVQPVKSLMALAATVMTRMTSVI